MSPLVRSVTFCILVITFRGTFAAEHYVSAVENLENSHPISLTNPPMGCANLSHKKASRSDRNKENENPTSRNVLLDFMGKGTAVARDIGVLKALHTETELLKGQDLQFAGNSSGSLLAAYFACWGVSAQTIEDANKMLLEFDYNLIASDTRKKMKQLAVGADPEAPHENITPLIEQVLTRNGIKCDPKGKPPLIIAASNGDVLDNRVMVERRGGLIAKILDSLDLKKVDLNNYDVTLDGKIIGKACTYFVTPSMYQKLSKLPYSKRLCELRVIEDYNDLFLAIKASVSEPTYFPGVEETNPGKIKDSLIRDHRQRLYIGGFLNQTLAEDLKKVEPNLYAITTGMEPLTPGANGLLQRWYLMSTNQATERGQRFIDLEFEAPHLWSRMGNVMTAEAWLQEGHSLAREQIRMLKSHCLLR